MLKYSDRKKYGVILKRILLLIFIFLISVLQILTTADAAAVTYGPCEVINDYSHVKISVNSSFYDDYLPASAGMRDNITEYKDGFYRLGFGGWIAAENVALIPERKLLVNRILSAGMINKGKTTEIRFAVTENVPVDAKCKDGVFYITLFNTPDFAADITLTDNPVFKTAEGSLNREKKTAAYTFDLIDSDNFYGFELVYAGGFIIVKVRNPMSKTEGNLPLKDLTVIVDAGHGGADPGALGFIKGKDEKDLSLSLALAVRAKLTELGADVVMTREKDETVDIYKRMDLLNKTNPDLAVSIHYNSVEKSEASSSVKGFEALYTNDAGRLLAKISSNSITSELNKVRRATKYQALAVCRNHKFPAALLEMAFITNPDEYEFALSEDGVLSSAEAIANGIIAWIDAQQKWVN